MGDHVNDLSYELQDLAEKVKLMGHNLEHSLETTKSSIETMIKKLQEQEEADEGE